MRIPLKNASRSLRIAVILIVLAAGFATHAYAADDQAVAGSGKGVSVTPSYKAPAITALGDNKYRIVTEMSYTGDSTNNARTVFSLVVRTHFGKGITITSDKLEPLNGSPALPAQSTTFIPNYAVHPNYDAQNPTELCSSWHPSEPSKFAGALCAKAPRGIVSDDSSGFKKRQYAQSINLHSGIHNFVNGDISGWYSYYQNTSGRTYDGNSSSIQDYRNFYTYLPAGKTVSYRYTAEATISPDALPENLKLPTIYSGLERYQIVNTGFSVAPYAEVSQVNPTYYEHVDKLGFGFLNQVFESPVSLFGDSASSYPHVFAAEAPSPVIATIEQQQPTVETPPAALPPTAPSPEVETPPVPEVETPPTPQATPAQPPAIASQPQAKAPVAPSLGSGGLGTSDPNKLLGETPAQSPTSNSLPKQSSKQLSDQLSEQGSRQGSQGESVQEPAGGQTPVNDSQPGDAPVDNSTDIVADVLERSGSYSPEAASGQNSSRGVNVNESADVVDGVLAQQDSPSGGSSSRNIEYAIAGLLVLCAVGALMTNKKFGRPGMETDSVPRVTLSPSDALTTPRSLNSDPRLYNSDLHLVDFPEAERELELVGATSISSGASKAQTRARVFDATQHDRQTLPTRIWNELVSRLTKEHHTVK